MEEKAMSNKIYGKIEYLFDRDWDEDLSDEDQDKLEQAADDLVAEYGWDEVYENAVNYLHKKCTTPESVVNFASNYWTYGWYNNPIPNPHKFLAYFYYVIRYDTQKYDPMDILDSLATTILPKAGFPEANLALNTQYMPENDPKIKHEVDLLKSSEK
jgi:hypothetical protein